MKSAPTFAKSKAGRHGFCAWWLGEVEYGAAWRLQQELVRLRQENEIPDSLLLLTHPRTITLGRNAAESHLLSPRNQLATHGFDIYDVDRGGDVTYHGPGQLVGYPIFDLTLHGKDLHRFLRNLEESLILALADYGIRGTRLPPHTGVWVDESKIAAIGIKVSRWVTSHGFALNVDCDLADFTHIVPCGIPEGGVTSVALETAIAAGPMDLIPSVLRGFISVFGARIRTAGPEWAARLNDLPAPSAESQKILQRGLDASKIDVIDYRPLSGDKASR